jgi:hypothetical protein
VYGKEEEAVVKRWKREDRNRGEREGNGNG